MSKLLQIPSFNAALGIYTKYASTPVNIRFQRFALQDHAARLLPKERVSFCLKRRIEKESGVGVYYNKAREKANFGNLIRCGSLWACPVCAAQISEQRRNELKKAIDNHTASGGLVYLLTLTNSHNASHSLLYLKTGQKKALKYFWSDRVGKSIFSDIGRVGHINSYEVTHGKNGWHPHHHILLFVNKSIDIETIKTKLFSHWLNCCKKANLPLPNAKHGLDLRDGSYAAKYASKWGLDYEMTKGHIKTGKQGSMTPFDLLKASEQGCTNSGKLFQEFVISFKGSRQLVWSRGLKDLLAVNDVDDLEIVNTTDKESQKILELDTLAWGLILSTRSRAEVLQIVEKDPTGSLLHEYINSLMVLVIQRE